MSQGYLTFDNNKNNVYQIEHRGPPEPSRQIEPDVVPFKKMPPIQLYTLCDGYGSVHACVGACM